MKLFVQPKKGWIDVKTDSDKLRTIFFIRPGASLFFVSRVKDEEEFIKISIYYNSKEDIVEIDGVKLEEDTEISIKKDDFVETFAFLAEDEIKDYDKLCKHLIRGND